MRARAPVSHVSCELRKGCLILLLFQSLNADPSRFELFLVDNPKAVPPSFRSRLSRPEAEGLVDFLWFSSTCASTVADREFPSRIPQPHSVGDRRDDRQVEESRRD